MSSSMIAMPPDINSLPTSPRVVEHGSQPGSTSASTTASRRTSMLPPAVPASASGFSSYHQPQSAMPPAARSPVMAGMDMGVPLRHPRPLTAAELYLECEKEQEAVVNRLTRELTALRAQTASVASNASHSSTSTGISQSLLPVDITDPNPTHQMTGPTHPTPSRRDRSSSSVSNRSAHLSYLSAQSSRDAGTGTFQTQQSQASLSRALAATGEPTHTLSRQNSTTASGRSTPARQSLDLSRQPSTSAIAGSRPTISRPPSQNALSTSAARSELEAVKAENEALRQRVRALERALRDQQRTGSGARLRRDSSLDSTRGSISSGITGGNTTTTTTSSGVSHWAASVQTAHDGGVGGVAGPRRERSESRSTTASNAGRLRSSFIGGYAPSTTTALAGPGVPLAPGVTSPSPEGIADGEVSVGESAASGAAIPMSSSTVGSAIARSPSGRSLR